MDNPVLDAARAKRAKHQSKLDSLLEAPTAESRSLTDDETTLRRNSASFEHCDLLPNGARRHPA